MIGHQLLAMNTPAPRIATTNITIINNPRRGIVLSRKLVVSFVTFENFPATKIGIRLRNSKIARAANQQGNTIGLSAADSWLHIVMTNPGAKEWASWIAACAIPPLGLLCWWLLKQLQSTYCHEEVSAIEQDARPAEEPRDVIEHFAVEQARAEEEEVGEAAMEAGGEVALPLQAAWQKHRLENWGNEIGDVIRQGHWLNGWNWSAMRPIERLVGWCLSKREKGEAQFLLGPMMPNWSNRWRTSAIAMAIGVAAIAAGTRQFNMVAVLALAVSIGSGVPVLGGAWPATNQGRISGKLSPIFGCYPLSYWSAGVVMFKANAVRTAAWLPLALTIGVLNARTAHTTIGYSLLSSRKPCTIESGSPR